MSHLQSQIRFLRLMENMFKSESVQVGLEAIEQAAVDTNNSYYAENKYYYSQ